MRKAGYQDDLVENLRKAGNISNKADKISSRSRIEAKLQKSWINEFRKGGKQIEWLLAYDIVENGSISKALDLIRNSSKYAICWYPRPKSYEAKGGESMSTNGGFANGWGPKSNSLERFLE